MRVDHKSLKRLQTLGIIEGISTLALFGVAMPLKYLAGLPIAVTLVGPIHGVLFVALAFMFLRGMKRIPISRGLAAAGIVAALFPFGPFIMHGRLGRIAAPENGPLA